MSEGKLLSSLGPHYCHRYGNVVTFVEEFCGKCPFNKPYIQVKHKNQT